MSGVENAVSRFCKALQIIGNIIKNKVDEVKIEQVIDKLNTAIKIDSQLVVEKAGPFIIKYEKKYGKYIAEKDLDFFEKEPIEDLYEKGSQQEVSDDEVIGIIKIMQENYKTLNEKEKKIILRQMRSLIKYTAEYNLNKY